MRGFGRENKASKSEDQGTNIVKGMMEAEDKGNE